MPRERRGWYKQHVRDPNVDVPKSSRCDRLRDPREENARMNALERRDHHNMVQDNGIEHNSDDDNMSVASAAGSNIQVDSDEDSHRSSASSVDFSEDDGNGSGASHASGSGDMDSELASDSDGEGISDYDEGDQENDVDDYVINEPDEDELAVNEEEAVLQMEVEDEGDRQPLYAGAQISIDESDILIMSFIVRWGLEDTGIEHLLRLIDCHMPACVLGSKFMFLKKFPPSPSMKMRYFGSDCSNLLPPTDGDVAVCTCGKACDVKKVKATGPFLVEMSIAQQLQQIMGKNELVGQMRKECADSDVISGKVYRRLRERGVIGNDDISLQWNTDGVSPFKTSKITIWPIQACINELPPQVRKDNMLLCGLYYGKTKPNLNTILKPFVDELERLHSVGIVCHLPGREQPVNVKVHTFLCSVDTVARAMLQGIMQFNGRYGCGFCLRRGRRIRRGRGYARVYMGGNIGMPRTQKQHVRALERLEQLRANNARAVTHVQGVKKGSVLLLIPVSNIIKSFVPEYMYSVLEGTVHSFLTFWCSSESENQPWHLDAEKRRTLNERLLATKPPVEVTRAPRGVDELPLWRAHEYKAFLLYYSLVVLKGLLPDRYLKHWMLFVYAITIFLKERIQPDEFLKAKNVIIGFVEDITLHYPNCDFLYKTNIHLLLHTPKAVEDFGALWASSAFPFEHFNGVISRLIKGTRNVPSQICTSFHRLRHVGDLSVRIFNRDDCSLLGKELYESMLWKYYKSKYSHLHSIDLRLFGAADRHLLTLVERMEIQRILGENVHNCAKSFRRMILRGQVFHASVYGALTVRDNSIGKLTDNSLVSITHILLVTKLDSNEECCITVCHLLQLINEELCLDRDLRVSSNDILHVCRRTDRIVAVPPQNFELKCVSVPYGNDLCIIPLVNNVERD